MDEFLNCASSAVVPTEATRVYKDECVYSFFPPESEGGLYVSMSTMEGVSSDWLSRHYSNFNKPLYLHIVTTRTLKDKSQTDQEDKHEPTKIAVAVPGGFNPDDVPYEVNRKYTVLVMPSRTEVPVDSPDLPDQIRRSVTAIIDHAGNSTQSAVSAWEMKKQVSRYAADLPVISNPPKISPSPSDWTCADCGAKKNLWMNLSDGYIGCGRKWHGVPESGCLDGREGAALRHYLDTGKMYPLVVKLGTITAHSADVFSYAPDEDDGVIDPQIAAHLTRFGINIRNMEKTEQSTTELEVAANKNLQFETDKITEGGLKLQPLRGARYVGLENVGNSCYMNSILQVIMSITEFEDTYEQHAHEILNSTTWSGKVAEDFDAQMAKLFVAALTPTDIERRALRNKTWKDQGLACADDDCEIDCLNPRMLKDVLCKSHPLFASNMQQDAVEFFQHFVDLLSKAEKSHPYRCPLAAAAGGGPVHPIFNIEVEERIETSATHFVRYNIGHDVLLSLPLPIEKARNAPEVREYEARQQKRQRTDDESASEPPVRPVIRLEDCLDSWAAPTTLDGFKMTQTSDRERATKRHRFLRYPKVLAIQLQRFYVGDDWTCKKRDVQIEVPETLDLEAYRASGLQPGENPMPDDGPRAAAAQRVVPSDELVDQVSAMGFSKFAAMRACIACDNAGVEQCINWVVDHLADADLNDPLPDDPQPPADGGGGGAASDEMVEALSAMGFTPQQARCGLNANNGDPDRAAEWLLSQPDLQAVVDRMDRPDPTVTATDTGSSRYQLFAMVSHMGSNTSCGHYVAHIKKDGRWVIYNDRKVAASEAPPLDLAYMHFYRRVDP